VAWLHAFTLLLRPAFWRLTFILDARMLSYRARTLDSTSPSLVFCIGVTNIGICAHGGERTKCFSPLTVKTLKRYENGATPTQLGVDTSHFGGIAQNLSVAAIYSVRHVVKRTSEILGSS